jgi:hypothetical protein
MILHLCRTISHLQTSRLKIYRSDKKILSPTFVNAHSYCSQVFLYCEHSIIFSFSHFSTFPNQALSPPIIRSQDHYRRLPSVFTSTCKYNSIILALLCIPHAIVFLRRCSQWTLSADDSRNTISMTSDMNRLQSTC